ncbi:MAG: hypothetical protein H7A35_07640 [Planctomycetales bacterium]|nr:hypothetical protein [bacterium]UNM09924.1 MAG: hypothetical protein H7A35_07640 [Planctomycetales bacterium]
MPVQLFAARDPLILDEAVSAVLPKGVEPERHYAAELNADTVFNQLGSGDLFASEKCFIYVDILDMKPGKRDSERITEILAKLPAETTLICTQLFSDPEKRSDEDRRLKTQAFTLWQKAGKYHDLRRQGEGDNGVRWLAARARQHYNLELGNAQAMQLLHLATDQLALADAELAKLALALDGGGRVTDELLRETVQGSPAAKFYEMADAVTLCRGDAQRLLSDWFRSTGDTFRLVNELKRRFSGMRTLRRGGNVYPPFFARSLQQFQRHYPDRRFNAAVGLLAQLEQDLKGGMYAGASSKDAEFTALQVFTADLAALPR